MNCKKGKIFYDKVLKKVIVEETTKGLNHLYKVISKYMLFK